MASSANRILNGKGVKHFLLSLGIREACLLSSLFCIIALEVPATAIRKIGKRNLNGKGRSMTLYRENPKDPSKNYKTHQ